VSFFEPPPPPKRPEPPPDVPPRLAWWEPPENELGAPVPLRLVIARSERVAVAVVGAVAYSTGIEFTLDVRRRRAGYDDEGAADFFEDSFMHPFGHPGLRMRRSAELPAEILRFGVEFSDGRKATTVGGHPAWEIAEAHGEGEPPQPVLSERSGGGSDGSWEQEFWLWPLPPPGPFAFVAEWLSEEIELTRREVDASVFLDPAQDSELLWPEQDSAGSPDGNDP
jgi:hypothetical protein